MTREWIIATSQWNPVTWKSWKVFPQPWKAAEMERSEEEAQKAGSNNMCISLALAVVALIEKTSHGKRRASVKTSELDFLN